MRMHSRQYAAIRHRKRSREMELEAEDQARAADAARALFGLDEVREDGGDVPSEVTP